jgi:hypothetical protein
MRGQIATCRESQTLSFWSIPATLARGMLAPKNEQVP